MRIETWDKNIPPYIFRSDFECPYKGQVKSTKTNTAWYLYHPVSQYLRPMEVVKEVCQERSEWRFMVFANIGRAERQA